VNIFENDYEIFENTFITLGKFDALHEGHRKLIETTVMQAKKHGCKSLVYTFNQNPKNVLNGEKIENLLSKEEKIEILKSWGVDYVVFQDFTYDFSRMLPEEFIEIVIKKKIKAKKIIVGFNFRFGRDAKGDVKLLEKIAKDFEVEVEVIEPVKRDGKIISSSLIREKMLIS